MKKELEERLRDRLDKTVGGYIAIAYANCPYTDVWKEAIAEIAKIVLNWAEENEDTTIDRYGEPMAIIVMEDIERDWSEKPE